ncbi:MAG TPA: DUF3857 and transglutaminase domain-containing protein [Micropepsaceae bacterium]|nr:DUF3857 and transglutaminase domain-containing protein [Micropepsaceae bacterium]
MRIHSEIERIDVQPDGTATSLLHMELQILTAQGVSAAGQIPIPYRGEMQDVVVVEAYTQKPDGRRIPVDPNAILTRQIPDASAVPLYLDVMEKLILFPDIEAGDTLVYTARYLDKATLFPGHFERVSAFSPALPVDSATVRISAPRSLGVVVETHDVELHKAGAGTNDVYTLHYANAQPADDDDAAISALDRIPRYFASSFTSYNDLAQTYAVMIQSKISVTPKIRAQADSITSGISDRREQARAIYEWVNQHIRYVGIEFGEGSVLPHDAESVLNNAFGDCKDHTILFAALLRAKGIDSKPVLINAENGYSLSSVPTTAQLDHMITWLPEFAIYADTTAKGVRFGYLTTAEYGKPVVIIDKAQPALRETPVLTANDGEITYRNSVKLDDNGRYNSEGSTTATGVFAAQLRSIGHSIIERGPDDSAAILLKRRGFVNATGKLIAPAPAGLSPSYSVESKFSIPGPVRIRHMEEGLRLMPVAGDFLMGPLRNGNLRDTDATPCYGGHVTEDLSLEFPATQSLVQLPDDADVKTSHLHYTSRWSVTGHTVSVHREFVSHIDQALCAGDVRKETAAALARIRKDEIAPLSFVLTSDAAGGAGTPQNAAGDD